MDSKGTQFSDNPKHTYPIPSESSSQSLLGTTSLVASGTRRAKSPGIGPGLCGPAVKAVNNDGGDGDGDGDDDDDDDDDDDGDHHEEEEEEGIMG